MELDTDRDVENFFYNSKPLLTLSEEEKSKGFEELKKIGLTKNDEFICLINSYQF